MADVASMRLRADALRNELSALRVAREGLLQEDSQNLHANALNDEVARLEREVAAERATLLSSGSTEDAKAAMAAAAADAAKLSAGTEGVRDELVPDMAVAKEDAGGESVQPAVASKNGAPVAPKAEEK
jgi:hypothetical protein